MKTILKKVFNKLSFDENYTSFLTIDNDYISGAVYKNDKFVSKSLVCINSSIAKGIERDNIVSKTLFAHSIAECIDKLEECCNARIKKAIVTLIGFNSRSINYSLSLNQVTSINLENLLQHVNLESIHQELGKDYFLTNLLPWKLNTPNSTSYQDANLYTVNNLICSNKNALSSKHSNNILESTTIDFLVAGFRNDFIYTLLEIFYNLSLKVDSFLFAPVILPLIISKKVKSKPFVIISKEYTLLYIDNLSKFIPFGTNLIFEKIAKKTNIPYQIILKYSYNIEQDILNPDNPLFYKIEEFIINDIKKIACNSIKEYIQELYSLIIDKLVNKRDTIIIINEKLKIFKEYGLLGFTDSLNIKFYDKNNSINLNKETFITDWITQGAFKYISKNYKKDIALLKFKKQASKLATTYGTIYM